MATIQGIYIALFGRPADPVGLAFFNQVTNGGQDLTAIGNLAGQPEYLDRFEGMSNQEIVTSIYRSLFNRDPELAGLTFFTQALANGTLTINNIAIAIYDGAQGTDRDILVAKEAAANAFTAALDTPAEIAAYQGNEAAQVGRDFLAGIPGTTSDPTDAIQQLLDNAQIGTTFDLTQGTDAGAAFTGTALNDTFNAPVQQTALIPIQTLNNTDNLDGGAGRDTLVAQLVTPFTIPVGINNIEVLTIEGAPGLVPFFIPQATLDVLNSNAIDTINFRAPNTSFTVNNLQTTLTNVSVTDVAFAGGQYIINNTAAAAAGDADEVDVLLRNVAQSSQLQINGAYETVNVDSQGPVGGGGANLIGIVTGATNVNVIGNASLNLSSVAFNVATLDNFDATTFTGPSITAAFTGTGDVNVEGSDNEGTSDNYFFGNTGNVVVNLNAGDDFASFGAGVVATADGGAGDDVFEFLAVQPSGQASFTSADSVEGGDGDDELQIQTTLANNGTTAQVLLAGVGANITGVEQITHTGSGRLITVDMARSGSANVLKLAADYSWAAGGVVTVLNLVNGDSVILDPQWEGGGFPSAFQSLVLRTAANTVNDIVELTLDRQNTGGGTGNLTIDALTVLAGNAPSAGIVEHLNIHANGDGVGVNVITNIDNVNAAGVKIDGDDGLTFGSITSGYAIAGGTIDGTESTGALNLFIGGNGSQQVAGGSGDDTIVLLTASQGGGNGADFVDLTAGGADTVQFQAVTINGTLSLAPGVNYHHVVGFDPADDIIAINRAGYQGGAANSESTLDFDTAAGPLYVNILNVTNGQFADGTADGYQFIRFTTAVDTVGDNATTAFIEAIGNGAVETAAFVNEVLAAFYDSTNQQMVLFTVDSQSNNTDDSNPTVAGNQPGITQLDDIDVIGTFSMTYDQFLAMDASNFVWI